MSCNNKELRGYYGEDFSRFQIEYDNACWYVKCKNEVEKRRDLLAYYLGKDWTNVAEVRELDSDIISCIEEIEMFPNPVDRKKTWIVKINQTNENDQICITNLDEAVAAELVFSLWIRRRDTHSYNRNYVDGIPFFFDHQTAFLGEEYLENINEFFNPSRNWAGYASVWRICSKNGLELTTNSVREYERKKKPPYSIHFVNDIAKTLKYIDAKAEYINKNDFKISENISMAGFDENENRKISDFLFININRIKKEIVAMKEIITHDY